MIKQTKKSTKKSSKKPIKVSEFDYLYGWDDEPQPSQLWYLAFSLFAIMVAFLGIILL